MKSEVRIDKWIWAMRLFKTRTIAADACKKGRIMVGNRPVKASYCIKVGDVVQVRKSPVTYSFQVLQLTENRLGAKLVPGYMANVTPADQYELLEMSRMSGFKDRDKGTGRPTKKERRSLDDFMADSGMSDYFFSDEFFEEDNDEDID